MILAAIITLKPQCSAVNPIYPYRTQAVRDLAWACFSNPLLLLAGGTWQRGAAIDCHPAFTEVEQRWLQTLDAAPAPLHAHLETSSNSRVGLYFEALWHFYLQHSATTELVAHNLPVRNATHTLGEFDCLYFCHRRQRPVHLELAVKYFLGFCADSSTGATDWIGPNKRDRLDIKLQHMLNKQMQLADLSESTAVLQDAGIDDPAAVLREIGIRGYLFQPFGHTLTTPNGHQPDSNGGLWASLQQLPALLNEHQQQSWHRYLVLPRIRWLSPAVLQPADADMNDQTLIKHFSTWFRSNTRPLLVAAVDEHGFEKQRFFVTPNDWTDDLNGTQSQAD